MSACTSVPYCCCLKRNLFIHERGKTLCLFDILSSFVTIVLKHTDIFIFFYKLFIEMLWLRYFYDLEHVLFENTDFI